MTTREALRRFEVLRFLHDAASTSRLDWAQRCTAPELAQLYAEASLMQHFIASIVMPMVDRTARARWLDLGQDDFAVAYRQLDTTLDGTPAPSVSFSLEGYRADVDAERESLRQHREGFEREKMQTMQYFKALTNALRERFGTKLVNTILAKAEKRARRRLNDGILGDDN